tara:strand:- start:677 stop:1060 length:384 start_codon:yes stop_codon:yes gene_type:complete
MEPNKFKGETKGILGDKERIFRLTFESIVSIENRTGKSIMSISMDLGLNKYSMRDMVIVLDEGLKGAGGKFTFSSVGDMVMRTGLLESSKLVAKVLTTIFTGEKKEDSDSPLVPAENVPEDTQSKTT